jgi:heat shock protein HslJ
VGRLTACLVALVLVLAACGDDGGQVSAGAGGDDDLTFDDLVGSTFVSTSVTGHELVDGTEINLTFIDGRLSALAGCNTQNGDADVEDGRLVVERLASTMMGCEDDLMAQDRWLAELLEGDPEVTLDGETLTLSAGDVVIELAEQQPG